MCKNQLTDTVSVPFFYQVCASGILLPQYFRNTKKQQTQISLSASKCYIEVLLTAMIIMIVIMVIIIVIIKAVNITIVTVIIMIIVIIIIEW